ncbi:MAG: FtsQ-type POTRA domain-containing protein [Patescibacteria group bacterium]
MLPAKKRPFRPSRLAERRRKAFFLWAGSAVACSLALAGLLAWASGLPEVVVGTIRVEGSAMVSEDDIRERVEGSLTGRYAGLFARANIFLVSPGRIESDLLGAFKEFKTVSVSRESLDALAVKVEERKPYYLWCEKIPVREAAPESAEDRAHGGCYFLDLEGLIFTPAPEFSGTVYFEFYGPSGSIPGSPEEPSGDGPAGRMYLPGGEFDRVIMFKNSLRDVGLNPYAFVTDGTNEYEFLLPGGGKIMFRRGQDFDVLFDNLTATLDTELFKKREKKGGYPSLEYIDMRFPDKVYYRFH